MKVTLIPATLAIILVSAIRISREIVWPSWELALAAVALVGALAFRINPTLLLLGGGVVGAVFLRDAAKGGPP